ncbi:MAG: RNA-protein complex protein Nop10 [Candidatus Thorarchaeota archaeon]
MTGLFRCIECKQYTLEEDKCPKCGGSVVSPRPPKYSPQDRYGKYRREAKRRARIHSK